MKTYISGKISGLPITEAKKNFEAAAKRVQEMGHEPVNPMEISRDHHCSWSEHMFIDLMALVHMSERIHLQANWECSTGARIEYLCAKHMHYPIDFEFFPDEHLQITPITDRICLTRAEFRVMNQDQVKYWIDSEVPMRHVRHRRIRNTGTVQTAIIGMITHTYSLPRILEILKSLDPLKYIPQPHPKFS